MSSTARSNKTRVLICAQSNIAVDEIVLRLNQQGYLGEDGSPIVDPEKIVRIGTISSHKNSVPQNFSSPSKIDELRYSSFFTERSSIERLVDDRRILYAAASEKCPNVTELRKEIIGSFMNFFCNIILLYKI